MRKARGSRQESGVRSQKPAESASARAERALVNAALGKLQSGGRPTGAELAALKRFERIQEEDRRWQYLRATPKKIYMEVSGRSARVLIDQARRLGLPYPEGTREAVDLTKVIRWFHDLLAEHSQKLTAPDCDDPMFSPSNSPAMERYRLARACREELALAKDRRQLIEVDELLGWYDAEVAAPIRKSLETLQRQFGQPAMEVVLRGLERAEVAVTKRLGSQGSGVRSQESGGDEHAD